MPRVTHIRVPGMPGYGYAIRPSEIDRAIRLLKMARR